MNRGGISVSDLFECMRVQAPTMRVPGPDPEQARVIAAARVLDRSALYPPEVQWVPPALAPRDGLDPLPRVELVVVTPELAAARVPNFAVQAGKKPFRDKCERMEEALARGLVPYRGRTVVEDRAGLILDGIVLLTAVARSGVPALCHWVSGVAPDAIAVMDRHRRRPGEGIPGAAAAVAAAGLGGSSPHADLARLSQRSTWAWLTLTPAMAAACLDDRERRGLPTRRVGPGDELARDVAAGHFMLTGQPIAFDAANVLRDGARRCHAVVQSGKPIRVLAVYGLDPALPDAVFDCTAPEGLGFHMQRARHTEGWDAQSSLRLLCGIDGDLGPTHYDMWALYKARPEIDPAIVASRPYQDHLCQSVHVAVRAHIAGRRSPAEAAAFLDRVLTDTSDAKSVKAFRRKAAAGMTPAQLRAARMVWRLVGNALTDVPSPARRREAAATIVEAFLRFGNERVSRRNAGGYRFPHVRPSGPGRA